MFIYKKSLKIKIKNFTKFFYIFKKILKLKIFFSKLIIKKKQYLIIFPLIYK